MLESSKENGRPIQLKSCSVAAGIATGHVNKRAFCLKVNPSGCTSLPQPNIEMYKDFTIMKKQSLGSSKSDNSGIKYMSSKMKLQGYNGFGGHSKADLHPVRVKRHFPNIKKRLNAAAGTPSIANYTIDIDD